MSLLSVLLNKIGLKSAAAKWFSGSRVFEKIKAEVIAALPKIAKLRSMSADERREVIVKAVEAVIDARYPTFAPFIDSIIEAVVARIGAIIFVKRKP